LLLIFAAKLLNFHDYRHFFVQKLAGDGYYLYICPKQNAKQL